MNREAAVLANVLFPSEVLIALGVDHRVGILGSRIFLAQFHQHAENPDDPVECLLLDQLALAHLRVGHLHALATEAKDVAFKQMYLNGATRLLAEICKTVQTLSSYRAAQRGQVRPKKKADHRHLKKARATPVGPSGTAPGHGTSENEDRHSDNGGNSCG